MESTIYEYYEMRESFLFVNEFLFFTSTPRSFHFLIKFAEINMLAKDHFMSPIAFILSHLIFKYPNTPDLSTILNSIWTYYPEATQNITKGRLLNILTTGLIANQDETLKTLGHQKYSQFVKEVMQHLNCFVERVDRKICIIGLSRVLEIEASNNQSQVEVLMAAVRLLGLQYNRESTINSIPIYSKNDGDTEEENQMEQETDQEPEEQQLKVESLVEFDSDFNKKFHHPADALEEFEVFNKTWSLIKSIYSGLLSPAQQKSLRNILDVRKVEQKTRRIVRVRVK